MNEDNNKLLNTNNKSIVEKNNIKNVEKNDIKNVEKNDKTYFVEALTFIILFFLLYFIFYTYNEKSYITDINKPIAINDDDITKNKEVDYTGIPYMVKNGTKEEIKKDNGNKLSKTNNKFRISAYSEKDSCHYPTKNGCLTASGKIAKIGMVATNLYPFGTKLKINNKIYTVEDRISKRYNNRIDIFFGYGNEAYNQAIKWGIKTLTVEKI